MLGRITVTHTFTTTATPTAVWAALEAAPRWPEVLTDLVSARIEPDGVLAEGAIIRTVAKPGTRAVDMTYRVTAADPRLHLAIEFASRRLPRPYRLRDRFLRQRRARDRDQRGRAGAGGCTGSPPSWRGAPIQSNSRR